MSTRLVAAIALAGLLGCQTYDFEPVRPLAVAQTVKPVKVVSKEAKPNLFLVVDKSGSMNFSADPSPTCATQCGASACGANGCKTRIGELKASMGNFLTTAGNTGHMGMVPFPNTGANACGPSALGDIPTLGVDLDIGGSDADADLQANANNVNAKIQALTPSGGTPTGPSLRALKDYDPLLNKSRSNYVLLLTDGQPNCNPALDSVLTTCDCTFTKPNGQPCQVAGLNQCLDKDGTVADITTLKGSGIKTIVIGFGAELTAPGQAVDTLTAMANAGGFQRPCATDADCGSGNTCSVMAKDPCGKDSKVCARTFFTAQNAGELTAALVAIGAAIGCSDPCTQILSSKPSQPELVSVIIDGVNVPATDPVTNEVYWSYDQTGPSVNFPPGKLYCNELLNATTSKPVNLEIRVVQAL